MDLLIKISKPSEDYWRKIIRSDLIEKTFWLIPRRKNRKWVKIENEKNCKNQTTEQGFT